MSIAAIIQSQMLQTLLQAMQAADAPLQEGKTVQARFIGWGEAAAEKAAASARAGAVPMAAAQARALAPAAVTAPAQGPSTASPAPAPAPPLPAGKAAALVEINGRQVTLLLDADAGRRAALQPGAVLTLRAEARPAAGQLPRMQLIAIEDGPAGSRPAPARPDIPEAAPQRLDRPDVTARLAAARAVGPLLGAALGRQSGLAPLFADLSVLTRSPAVSTPVAQAAARVLALRLDVEPAGGGSVPEPAALREAVRSSGLFFEARAAQGDVSDNDLKQALLSLRSELKAALPPSEAPASREAEPRPGAAATTPAAAAPARPAPILLSGQPQPQGPALASIDMASDSAASMLGKALERTEGALERMSLNQYASLPNAAEASSAQAPLNRWFTELPIALDGRTAVLPLEIEEDGAGPSADGPTAKLWRVRFALEAEPIGAVHATVTMQGRVIGVSVWAEREATSRLVRDHAPDLEAALLENSFERAQIEVLAAKPKARALQAGRFLDRSS